METVKLMSVYLVVKMQGKDDFANNIPFLALRLIVSHVVNFQCFFFKLTCNHRKNRLNAVILVSLQ